MALITQSSRVSWCSLPKILFIGLKNLRNVGYTAKPLPHEREKLRRVSQNDEQQVELQSSDRCNPYLHHH